MKEQVLFLTILIVLNFADVATTLYGLSIGGTELNPFFHLEELRIKIVLPFIYAFLFLGSYYFCQKIGFDKGLKILSINLAILIIIYLLVVINNLNGIIRVTFDLF